MDVQKIFYERLALEMEFTPEKVVERPEPLVSVSIITYQHNDFIRECLDGILMQQTDFPYEIIIGEDGSTDGTRDICIEYAEKYPERIRLFLRNRKTSQLFGENGEFICRFNGKWNREFARGKYIALCEGDDYWTDPYKLQRQIEFLERNPNYSACFTNAKILDQKTGKENLYLLETGNRSYSMDDVITKGGGLFPTASLVFINRKKKYPGFLMSAKSGDRALSLNLAEMGDFYYIDDITCVYRTHDGGVYSGIKYNNKGRILIHRDNIHLLEQFNIYTQGRYSATIKKTISHMALKILLNSTYRITDAHFSTLMKKLIVRHKISYLKGKVMGFQTYSQKGKILHEKQ